MEFLMTFLLALLVFLSGLPASFLAILQIRDWLERRHNKKYSGKQH